MKLSQAIGTSLLRTLQTIDATTSFVTKIALTADEAADIARGSVQAAKRIHFIQLIEDEDKEVKRSKITEEKLQQRLASVQLPDL